MSPRSELNQAHQGLQRRRPRPKWRRSPKIVAAPIHGSARTYKHWRPEEIAFLIRTHATLPLEAQARVLQRPLHGVREKRKELYASGRIRTTERFELPDWSPTDDEELQRLVQNGLPLFQVAKQLNRSYAAVCQRTERFGGVRAMRGQTIQVRSLLGVARLFGVPDKLPDLWRRHGWLTARRNDDARRPKAKKRTYLVTDAAIQEFLAVHDGWATWEPRTIRDPIWRAEAEAIRAQATGTWLTYPEIAARYGVDARRVAVWAKRGEIQAIKIGRTHFVWSETLADVVPPHVRYHRRGPRQAAQPANETEAGDDDITRA
ncbi:MAG TPA: hypothetical protein VFZ66_27535 [Herpetosiphonaceae bacterium]